VALDAADWSAQRFFGYILRNAAVSTVPCAREIASLSAEHSSLARQQYEFLQNHPMFACQPARPQPMMSGGLMAKTISH
jgi:hypothetical protein